MGSLILSPLMGMKLPPDELALYQGIDEILWKDWDPIGISRLEPAPRDEYHRYLNREINRDSHTQRLA
jgi:hypothetical protein